jgi:outer membrane protein assembly factor BamB
MNRTKRNDYTTMILVKLSSVFLLIVLLVAMLPSAPIGHAAYIEPELAAAQTKTVSVIVVGVDSQQVARVVRRLGGEVTNDLWLIDGVAATIPASQLERLSQRPEIHAVMANRGIKTADDSFDGWVNTRRIYQNTVSFADQLESAPVPLADGGIAAISVGGTLQIIDPDGRERSRVSLPQKSYPIPALSDNQSNIYLIQNEKILALSSQGQRQWTFDNNKPFIAFALAEEQSILYAVDEKDRLTALNLKTGKRLWRTDATTSSTGSLIPALTVDNGLVYVSTDKGYLAAFASDGKRQWKTRIASAAAFRQPLQIHSDGSVYVAGQDNVIYGINAGGGLKFRFQVDKPVVAGPVLAGDGSIYAATRGAFYALNQDGSLRFQKSFDHGNLPLAIVLAPGAETVYALTKEGKLFAMNARSGALSWQYDLGAQVKNDPVVEGDGTLHIVDANEKYTILNPFGVVSTSFDLESKDGQQPVLGVNPRRNVYIPTKRGKLHIFTRLPNQWDGRPDVEPTANPTVWKLANPVATDIGADLLHTPQLPNHTPVTGNGVTVAVVDSGVQFDPAIQQAMGTQLADRFWGQADFVEEVCTTGGIQQQGYCFTNATHSQDGYGHGSHVAGIIWNSFTDSATGVAMGVAPGSKLLSVRVLDANGTGSYADAIEGIQYVVANRDLFNIRVLNLSISAYATTPYFVDPLNRAVEKAWAHGIVVIAAAGNEGPEAETITVPGNDPYIITVGALDSLRTPGFWRGDTLPVWSATGPTLDGFVKPDILAPGAHIISFAPDESTLSQSYPANVVGNSLFRMSGTSMATAVASGVVALMLEVNPLLTPDQVKFRLAYSARPATTSEGFPIYNMLQQGMGRIWAPTAVFGSFPSNDYANQGMDIHADLAHGWKTEEDLGNHYQGPIRRIVSDDGTVYLYYTEDADTMWGLGAVRVDDKSWVDWKTLAEGMATWAGGQRSTSSGIAWAGGLTQPAGMATWAGGMATWAGGMATWAGGMATWAGGMATWAGGMATWAGGMATWAGGMATWAGGMATWAGGMATWAGGMATWAGGMATWAGGMATWAGGINVEESVLAGTSWVNDDGSTAALQSHTVFNPVPADLDVQPAPNSDTGIQRIFLPALSR